MTTTIYPIHRAINKPLGFKGLKAQWLLMAGAAIVGDMLLFVILYIAGVNSWIDILIAFGLGAATFSTALRLSRQYGEYGLMKRSARRKVPRCLRCHSRQVFLQLKPTICTSNFPTYSLSSK
ncbi:MAG TPA: DUF4133 domain-containing protein [Puia sp.]